MYSDMSYRMNSTPRTLPSWRANSVLPTPVGPVKRKLPIGLSGDRRPERDKLDRRCDLIDGVILPEDRRSQLGAQRGQGAPIVG